jgi:hypothetical protein
MKTKSAIDLIKDEIAAFEREKRVIEEKLELKRSELRSRQQHEQNLLAQKITRYLQNLLSLVEEVQLTHDNLLSCITFKQYFTVHLEYWHSEVSIYVKWNGQGLGLIHYKDDYFSFRPHNDDIAKDYNLFLKIMTDFRNLLPFLLTLKSKHLSIINNDLKKF